MENFGFGLYGRRKIEYDSEITAKNVVEAIKETQSVHAMNKIEMEYLYNMYLGSIESVQSRRPGEIIRNVAITNYAYVIANFDKNYFLSDPVSVVNAGSSDKSEDIEQLNKIYEMASKQRYDEAIAKDFVITGQGLRLVIPNQNYSKETQDFESPVKIISVNPKRGYVIYSTDVMSEPLAGVIITYKGYQSEGGDFYDTYTVYTKTQIFTVENNQVTKKKANTLRMIPLIEFLNEEERLGSFEPVHTLIEKASLEMSMRLDGSQQKVDAYLIGENIEMSDEDLEKSKKQKFISFPTTKENPGKLYYISPETNQSDEQILFESLHDTIFEITSLPQSAGRIRSLGNNGASLISEGWQNSELKAKGREELWKQGEIATLKLTLRICRAFGLLKNLSPYDVDFKFNRRNYENVLSKAQVLSTLLPKGFMLDPESIISASGLWIDEETVYNRSVQYTKAQQIEGEKLSKTITEQNGIVEEIIVDN